jgi:hypothetical protein
VSGTIIRIAGDSVSILIAIDDDYSRLQEIGTFVSGSTFTLEIHIESMSHRVSVFAIDSTGAMSKSEPQPPTAEFTPALHPLKHRRYLRCAKFVGFLLLI